MPRKWNPRRRRFLEAAVTAAAAAPVISCSREKTPWRALTAAEAATLAAICDRIVPPDEDPGAAWAGAVQFIDLQLSGHLKKLKGLYRRALGLLAGFGDYPPARQVEILTQLEKGKAPGAGWQPGEAREFFNAVRAHTMQSFYGDPRHGGNRDMVGYRMLGIPVTPVRGREQHDLTQISGVQEPKRRSS